MKTCCWCDRQVVPDDHSDQRCPQCEREFLRSRIVRNVLVYYHQSRTLDDQDPRHRRFLEEILQDAESYVESLSSVSALSTPEQAVSGQ